MFKKSLAVIVPAMLTMSVTSHATMLYKTDSQDLSLFGRAKFDVNHQENSNANFSSRLGVKGHTQVNAKLSAFFSAQWEMQSNRESLNSNHSDTQDNIQSRAVYVGLDYGDFGSLKLGQDHSLFYSSLTMITDIFDYGGQESYVGTPGYHFNANQAIYTNHVGPLSVQVGYQFDTHGTSFNEAKALDLITDDLITEDDSNISVDQSNASSLAATYDTELGLNIRAAYARQNFAQKTSGDAKDQTNYGFGVDYTRNDLYVAALYTQTKLTAESGSVKKKGYELAAKYNLGKISLLTGYAYARIEQGESYHLKVANAFKLGMQYHFTSHVKGMLGWVNNSTELTDKNPNTYSAGLQYNF